MLFNRLKSLVDEGKFAKALQLAKENADVQPTTVFQYNMLLEVHSAVVQRKHLSHSSSTTEDAATEAEDAVTSSAVGERAVANTNAQISSDTRSGWNEQNASFLTAQTLYRTMRADPTLVPDYHTYNALFSILRRLSKMKEIEALLADMKERGFPPDVKFFNHLLYVCYTRGNEERLLNAMEMLKQAGLRPNINSYIPFVRLYARRKNEAMLFKWLHEMQSRGIEHTPPLMNLLIVFWVDVRKADLAWAIVEKLKARGLRPELNPMRSLMELHLATKDAKGALACFRAMKEFGYRREVRYNSLLCLLANNKEVDEVVALFRDMKEYDVELQPSSYHALILMHAKLGDIETVETLVVNMHSQGFAPGIYTYNAVIDMYSRTGRVDEACEIYDEMMRHGVEPDVATCSIMVLMLCRLRRVSQAHSVLEQVKKYGVVPDVRTYNKLLETYVASRNTHQVRVLYDEMRQQGGKPNFRIYRYLMSHSFDEKRVHDVVALYRDMRSTGLKIDPAIYPIFQNCYHHLSNPNKILGYCANVTEYTHVNETALKFAQFELNEKRQEEEVAKILTLIVSLLPPEQKEWLDRWDADQLKIQQQQREKSDKSMLDGKKNQNKPRLMSAELANRHEEMSAEEREKLLASNFWSNRE